jgi:hypothetical protein
MTNVNFLGIPVEGEITKPTKRTPQKPLSELEPLMRAVLDDTTMKAFGWSQYTPYFNDGEPCVFSTNQPWFLTDADPDPDDVEDFYNYEISSYGDGHPSLGKKDGDWVGQWPDRRMVNERYEGPDEQRHDRARALSDAIEGGAFDDVLLEAFGDHAEIRVTASGITVDTYSHD